MLFFGCAYHRIAVTTVSATTLRRPQPRRPRRAPKRSTVVDANGSPPGTVAAPANCPDASLPEPTLMMLDDLGVLPPGATVHLGRGDDSAATRERLADRGLRGEIARMGRRAPIAAAQRWPVERTNAHRKFVWCTERRAVVVAFWLAFSAAIIVVGRLVRAGWTRYRCDGRPSRQS